MRNYLILLAALFCISVSCSQPGNTHPGNSDDQSVEEGYSGTQYNNTDQQFLLHILLNKDGSAFVMSGNPRYINGAYVEGYHDEENLRWSLTDDGFVLTDPETGNTLYTAVNIDEYWTRSKENRFPPAVSITWSHSAGVAWDTFAAKYGWQQNMILHINWICETV